MAKQYSTEAQLLQNLPRTMPNGSYAGGRVRRYRNTIALASQPTTDTIALQPIPAGHVFCYGVLVSTVTLGPSTLAIGNATDAAKYRTAATFTAVETPTLFGKTTVIDDDFLTATEEPIITIAGAALPASGFLTVDLYFSGM